MTEDEKAIARGIAAEKKAEGAETGLFVVLFLVIGAAVIFLGLQFGWGGWAALWAFLAACVGAGYLTHGIKDRLLA